jgi:hypothetical protein
MSTLKTPSGPVLSPLNHLKDLTLDDIDAMDNETMRHVIDSVVRRQSVPQAHKSHNSHSSTADREKELLTEERTVREAARPTARR